MSGAHAWYLVAGLVAMLGVFGVLNALTNRRYVFEDGMVHGVVGRMGSGKSLFIVQRVLIPFCRRLSKKGVIYSTTERPVRRVITNFKFDPRLPNVEVLNVEPTSDSNIFAQLILLSKRLGHSGWDEDGVSQGEGPWKDANGVLQDGRKTPPPGVERQPILNALVILDEMHFFIPTSKVAMDEDAAYAISMARKWNCEMWWASQHEMKVNKRLRDESSALWLAGKLGGPLAWLIGDGWHVCRQFESSTLVEKARQAGMGGRDMPRSRERRMYRYTRKVGEVYNSFELLKPDPSSRSTVNRKQSPRLELVGAEGTSEAARASQRRRAERVGPSAGTAESASTTSG